MPQLPTDTQSGFATALQRYAGKKFSLATASIGLVVTLLYIYIEVVWKAVPVMPQMTDDAWLVANTNAQRDLFCAIQSSMYAIAAICGTFALAQGWGPDKMGRRSEGVTDASPPEPTP